MSRQLYSPPDPSLAIKAAQTIGVSPDHQCPTPSQVTKMTQTLPNIKQRKDAVSRGKPNRRKAAEIFDEQEYKKRSLIEGIFEAEETKRHQLHCRFLIESNRLRFGKIRTIAWNLKVFNRLRCTSRLGIPIPAYAA